MGVKGQFISFHNITSVATNTAMETKIKNQSSPMLIIPFLAHRSISSGLLVFRSAAKTIAFKTKDNLFRIFRKLMAFYNLDKEQLSVAIKHLFPLK